LFKETTGAFDGTRTLYLHLTSQMRKPNAPVFVTIKHGKKRYERINCQKLNLHAHVVKGIEKGWC